MVNENTMKNLTLDQTTLNYWEAQAGKLSWHKPWSRTVTGDMPFLTWFADGEINASVNCLDRHCQAGQQDKIALIWEGENGELRTFTFQQLLEEVEAVAQALRAQGIRVGDRVGIVAGMVPEAVFSMLACSRIGAIHSVIFAGFGKDAIAQRLQDLQAKLVITATGSYRRGKIVPLFNLLQEVLPDCPSVQKLVVIPLATVLPSSENYLAWSDFLLQGNESDCTGEPEYVQADSPLFVLYTSGTTGKPKGIVHTTGGYLTAVQASFEKVFQPQDTDIYWCTADLGWITGHSYVVYGPLLTGTTVFMYEGAMDYPDLERSWLNCQKHGVTIYYTAPTLIRQFMRLNTVPYLKYNLSSLRLLGSVGEPINPTVWQWFADKVGAGICSVVDTWWQTETGAIVIAPEPGITRLKPGSATLPLPGMHAAIVDEKGEIITIPRTKGYVVLTQPWPSMPLGIWQDSERYMKTYWQRFPGYYFAGDYCSRDEDGYFWLQGRADDIILVAGHNISTAEVESALVAHPELVEAAVVDKADDVAGHVLWAFVVLKASTQPSQEKLQEIRQFVARTQGPIVRPAKLLPVSELPKTQSGKIIRRLLRSLVNGEPVGDVSTITNPQSIEEARMAIATP